MSAFSHLTKVILFFRSLVLSAQQEELNDSGNTSPLQLSTQSSQTSGECVW